MVSMVSKLTNKKLISPPTFVKEGIQYEALVGSKAYGVSSNDSDRDIYGWCMPPLDTIYPHLAGEIQGFGKQHQRFEQFEAHHVKDDSKEYDLSIYSIVKYFNLVMQNNPNMLDSLFVPDRCVIYASYAGQLVRDHRKIFLHKGCYHRFKGYAYNQLHKIKTKKPQVSNKRADLVAKYTYDTKSSYHLVRLLNECEQLLTEGDLDLQRNREQLKSIRNGEWTINQIEDYFSKKESELETAYLNSKLPYSPNEKAIKQLLLECIESTYGRLDNVVSHDRTNQMGRDIQTIVDKYISKAL